MWKVLGVFSLKKQKLTIGLIEIYKVWILSVKVIDIFTKFYIISFKNTSWILRQKNLNNIWKTIYTVAIKTWYSIVQGVIELVNKK